MILLVLLSAVSLVLSWLTSWLPQVTTLPYGMDQALQLGVAYFRWAATILPLLTTLMTYGLIYLGWKVTLRFLRIIRFYV